MIQGFTEKLYSRLDEAFERQANLLLDAARNFDPKISLIAGKMDGLTEATNLIRETYKLFITEEKSQEDDNERSLY